MSDNFTYGRCERYNCTMSTEFCEKYRRLPSYAAFDHNGRNNSKCAGCGGLTMTTTDNKAIEPIAAAPADQRPAFQDRLRSLMAAKPATYREVAEAVNLSQMTVRAWTGGGTIPTVNQAQLLDDFFGTNLVDEYNDLLRKAHGNKGVKSNRAAKIQAADPKPDEQAVSPNPFVGVLKGVANLEKKVTDAAKQAHAEVYGDSEAAETSNDRQMAMVILFKMLDCLCLIMGEKSGDLNYD